MRLVFISDTHLTTPAVPDGDVLVHAGDHTYHGRRDETKRALRWLASLPHRHKVFIPGNHEVGWEQDWRGFMYRKSLYAPDSTVLWNSEVTIDGLKFWGSPVQPYFRGWAFQKQRGAELRDHWTRMPDKVDVLITHGPPYGIGDRTAYERMGDEDLLRRVIDVKPTIHAFGHNHDGYGEYFFNGTHFINAAILNEDYVIAHASVVVDL